MQKKSLFDIIQKKTLILFYVFVLIFVGVNIFYFYQDNREQYVQTKNKFLNSEKNNLKKEVSYVVELLNLQNKKIENLSHKIIKSQTISLYDELISSSNNINKGTIIRFLMDFKKRKDEFGREIFLLDKRNYKLIFTTIKDKNSKESFINAIELNKDKFSNLLKNKNEGFLEFPVKYPNEIYPHFVVSYLKSINNKFIIGSVISKEKFSNKVRGIVRDFLNNYSFGKNKYVFVIRLYNINGGKNFGRMFVNPNRPDLVGKYLSDDFKDAKGKEFRKEVLKVLRENGSGFVKYWYKKPSTNSTSPKLTFWKLTADGKYIVAAGFYIDDFGQKIAYVKQNFYNRVYNFLLLSFLFLIFITVIYYYAIKKHLISLNQDFDLFSSFFKTVVQENKFIDLRKITFSELVPLAEHANQMLEEKIYLETNLKEEKDKLLVTMQSIGDGLITTDNKGKVTFLNKVAEKLTGWENSDAYGKNIEEVFNIVNEVTREKVPNPVNKVLKSGKTVALANHTLLISKNGDEYNIADSAAPILNDENKIIGVVFIFRDVTKEYKLLEQTQKAKETTEAIIRALPDLLFIFNKKYEFIKYVAKDEKSLFVTPSKFIGQKLRNVLPPNIALLAEAAIDKALLTEETVSFEYSSEIDGKTTYYEARLTYKGNDEVLAIVRDITEKKLALIALKKSEEDFKRLSLIKKAILESPHGIIIFALDKDYKYIDFTLQHKLTMKAIWGEDIEIGKCMLDYIKNEKDRISAKENFDRALRGESFILIEEYGDKKLQRTYYEDRYAPVYNDEGEIIGLSVYVIDVTERMQAQQLAQDMLKEVEEKADDLQKLNEELKKAKEKAEASDKLKTEFLAQISHEIRSPLNVIINFTSMLKEELAETENEIIDMAFTTIESSSRRIIRTIELLINVSELQLGTYNSKNYRFDIKEMLNNIYNEFTQNAKAKKLDLKIEINTDETEIYSDEYAISQMVVNLVDNAIKYTNEGYVKISLNKKDNKFYISVEDTGIGISDEFLPYLFKAFRQEEQGYHRRFEGSGLGMSLIKKYAETIGAEIKVKSEKGKGSTFTIVLEIE